MRGRKPRPRTIRAPDLPILQAVARARRLAWFQVRHARIVLAVAGVRPRANVETGVEEPWELKDLRKTCATYYDEHVPESSVEILGHSVGGITYRHYAHRAPLAFKAIMTIPVLSATSRISTE